MILRLSAVALCFLLIASAAHAQESPLEVAANLTPSPVIVIPDEGYRWEAKLIADKLSERLAQRQERVVGYFTKKENLFKEVKIQSSDKGRYIAQSMLSYPANLSWNPDKEGEGIEVLGGGYAVYNDLYVSDYKDDKVTIKPVYYIFDLDKKVGKTITIKGERYLVLEYNSSGKYIKLAKAVEKRLYSIPSQPELELWAGKGMRLGSYVKPGNKSGSAILMPTAKGSHMGSVLINISSVPQDITGELKEYFPGYYIYITEAGDDYITLAFAEKSGEMKVYNGQAAFGYSTSWLPSTVAGHANSLVLVGNAITLERYDSAQLEGTPYFLRLSNYYLSIAKQGLLGSFASGSTLRFEDYRNHLKSDVNISIESGKVKLEYFTGELDDNTSVEDDFSAIACSADMFLVRNCSAANWGKEEGLKVDGDGDGKLSGSQDYVVYSDFLVWERRQGYIEISPVRIINISANSLIRVEGKKYYVLKSNMPDSIELMQARDIKLYSMPGLEYGTKAVEGLWFVVNELKKSNTSFSFNLFILANGSLLNTLIARNVTPGDELEDLREWIGRRVFLKEGGSDYIILVIQTGGIEEVYDGEPWLGYKKVRMGFDSLGKSEMALFGGSIRVGEGRYEEIKGTSYYAVYRDRKLDIIRKKSLKVNPGERLDSSRWPWGDFLKDDLTFFISQEVVYPGVEIKLAGEGGENSNLILLGTEEENPLIKKLVEENVSRVRWEKSEGSIEVVGYENRTVIIIGGRDRKAVERAVEGFVRGAVMEYIEVPEEREEIKANLPEKMEKNETGISTNATKNETINSSGISKPAEKEGGFIHSILREIARFISRLFGGNK